MDLSEESRPNHLGHVEKGQPRQSVGQLRLKNLHIMLNDIKINISYMCDIYMYTLLHIFVFSCSYGCMSTTLHSNTRGSGVQELAYINLGT